MSNVRLDALCVREDGDKSYWTRIGVAFPTREGAGWTILLDAMPAASNGQYKILLREPREENRDSGQRAQGNQGRHNGNRQQQNDGWGDERF